MKVRVYSLLAEGGNAYWGYKIKADSQDNVLQISSDIAGSGNSQITWYPPLAHMYEPGPYESVSTHFANVGELIKELKSNHPELELRVSESEEELLSKATS